MHQSVSELCLTAENELTKTKWGQIGYYGWPGIPISTVSGIQTISGRSNSVTPNWQEN